MLDAGGALLVIGQLVVRRFLRASLNRQPPKPKEMKMTVKGALGFTALSLLMPCVLLGLLAGCKTNQPTAAKLQHLQGYWEGELLGRHSNAHLPSKVTAPLLFATGFLV